MVHGGATSASDLELLREYAQSNCAHAFAQIVRRHVAWIHAASLRQVNGDAHLAEDVTQAVFILLARRAATLPDGTLLTGWLFNTVRYAAAEARRKAARRRKHEAKAAIAAESPDPDTEDQAWRRLAPLLDETITLLRESERQAVLLRYFEDKSFEEIALAMGINEAAARKRVSRGVKRLREVFVNRGVIAPAVAVLTLLLTRAAGAAPSASFAQAIATTACRVGPTHALALSIVRQTTLRMLRARQRLAAAIVACAGVCFLGLWALLIASMLEPDAPEIADLIDPLDVAGSDPELVLLGQDRLPLDSPTLRADWTANRPPRRPRDATRPATDNRPPLDTFWRLRPDLDPRNGPSASARPARPDRPVPVRHDRDYDDSAEIYANYAGMGGGGGGGGGAKSDPNNRRNTAAPGQVNVTVANGNANSNAPRNANAPDRVRTASASGADDRPAPPADKPGATFRGNAQELTKSLLSPDGNRNAPFRFIQGIDGHNYYHIEGSGGPRGTRGPTDFVHHGIDPYPSNAPGLFGTSSTSGLILNSDGTVRGSGTTAVPVIVYDYSTVTAGSPGPIAFGPNPHHPWQPVRIYRMPGEIGFAPIAITTPVTVPEPATGLLAAAAFATIALSRRPLRSRNTSRQTPL